MQVSVENFFRPCYNEPRYSENLAITNALPSAISLSTYSALAITKSHQITKRKKFRGSYFCLHTNCSCYNEKWQMKSIETPLAIH
ncbi:hypothetical protein BDZ91DRAFT_132598 [Kalaharituber pfeilii]|nr:hypothetical protein BDZ91DRAFT_132598 [Kalaharituber pfeilii]